MLWLSLDQRRNKTGKPLPNKHYNALNIFISRDSVKHKNKRNNTMIKYKNVVDIVITTNKQITKKCVDERMTIDKGYLGNFKNERKN